MGSLAIHAFYDDGKYMIATAFVPTVTAVAVEEIGKVCSNVHSV
jgi:hypothetical protein